MRGGYKAERLLPAKFVHLLEASFLFVRCGLDEVEIRDNRYNQVIHMVSAAKGAEAFYTVEDHCVRSEGLEQARERDTKAAEAWVGHPYVDVIDNSSGG